MISDTVLVQVTIAATATAGWKRFAIFGCGFNGNPGPNVIVLESKPTRLVTRGIDWSLNHDTPNGTGFIGGTGAGYLLLDSSGDTFSCTGGVGANNNLFASGVAGFANVRGGFAQNQTVAEFLGSGCVIQGDLVDSTKGWYTIAASGATSLIGTLP
jgi:hypothetical protein